MAGSPDAAGFREYADDLMTLELSDGRRVHVISRGHMFNLAGPRPLGNSIESMDLGFALQARCLEAVANGSVGAASCVVPVPGRIDAAIATSYLDRKYPLRPMSPRAGGPGRGRPLRDPATGSSAAGSAGRSDARRVPLAGADWRSDGSPTKTPVWPVSLRRRRRRR
jgi:hypothetical protein